MLGSMAAVPLPRDPAAPWPQRSEGDPLHAELFERHRMEVPVSRWPSPPLRLLRVSAQLYNTPADFDRLAAALRDAERLEAPAG